MIRTRDKKTMEGMQIALDTTKRLKSSPNHIIISEQISLAHLYRASVRDISMTIFVLLNPASPSCDVSETRAGDDVCRCYQILIPGTGATDRAPGDSLRAGDSDTDNKD